jgi:ankyrin repeat protein
MRRGIEGCAFALVLAIAARAAGSSPVADAAMKGDMGTVKSLIQQKADVNAPQADGATALQWAAYRNNVAMADALIAAGANVKLANRDGATALRLASLNGNPRMIETLLKAGADPNEPAPSASFRCCSLPATAMSMPFGYCSTMARISTARRPCEEPLL